MIHRVAVNRLSSIKLICSKRNTRTPSNFEMEEVATLDCPQVIWELNSIYDLNLPLPLPTYVNQTRRFTDIQWPDDYSKYTVDREALTQDGKFTEEYLSLVIAGDGQNTKLFGELLGREFFKHAVAAHERLDPLSCPHIIKMHAAWKGLKPWIDSYIITQRYNPYDMNVLKNFPKEVIGQLLQALSVLHENFIFHRAIAPYNIVWEWRDNKPHIYLTGLSVSGYVPDEEHALRDKFKGFGVFDYMPLGDAIADNECLFPNDIWAAGVIFAELLLEKTRLFHTMEFEEFAAKKAELFEQAKADPLAVDLVNRLLEFDPKRRITAKEALTHKYFSNALAQQTSQCESDDVVVQQYSPDLKGKRKRDQTDLLQTAPKKQKITL